MRKDQYDASFSDFSEHHDEIAAVRQGFGPTHAKPAGDSSSLDTPSFVGPCYWRFRLSLTRSAPPLLVAGLLLLAEAASTHPAAAGPVEAQRTFSGRPAPAPPAVISRDTTGQATIRAVRTAERLNIDGRLDETVYAAVTPISDFIQQEPTQGAPATERTEVWVLFDANNVYVVARCWESAPERLVANEMRRDSSAIAVANDAFSFSFDTFHDGRNMVAFDTNPLGGRMDVQITNERIVNTDWNPVWDVATGRFDGGWVVEAAVPFKSLRYSPGTEQVWGIQLRRHNLWKNEWSFVTAVPSSFGMFGGAQASLAATLVGLEAPSGARNLEIKPYVVSSVRSDAVAIPPVHHDPDGDLGVDVKYGLTQNLTADFTYNTDFAQVEADEQQVNLTRFSLFFPEKREFFLENQGTFSFGGVATRAGGDTPVLFYSRRIGLNQGAVVPIQVGGRLTGRVQRFSLGLVSIRTDEELSTSTAPTTFSVVRLKHDVLRRSSIGAIFTGRSVAQAGTGSNKVYGLDGTFAFFNNLAFNTYWARSRTSGLSGRDTSYLAQMDYTGDRYGLQLERLVVGDHFNPEVGFVRRDDMRRSLATARFSPRPRRNRVVRRYSWTGSIDYVQDDTSGDLETRDVNGEFAIEFQNSDRFSIKVTDSYERLAVPFRIAPRVTLPTGAYAFSNVKITQVFGRQRGLSGTVAVERGSFYSGDKTGFSVTQGRLNLSSQLSIEPSYTVNWVDLDEGSFTTYLAGSRVTYTMTPLMFTSALLQYNSTTHAVSANVRLRWEYHPGSELFVVYNEDRNTETRGFPDFVNRALIVKVNRLLRP